MFIDEPDQMIMRMKKPNQADIDKFKNEAEQLTTKMKYVLGQVAIMAEKKDA